MLAKGKDLNAAHDHHLVVIDVGERGHSEENLSARPPAITSLHEEAHGLRSSFGGVTIDHRALGLGPNA